MNSSFHSQKALRRELKEKEQTVLNAVDQARVFLADQPIEGPEEPRRSLHSKTGQKILTAGKGQKKREKTCMSLVHILYPSYLLRPQNLLNGILMAFISVLDSRVTSLLCKALMEICNIFMEEVETSLLLFPVFGSKQ